MAACTNALMQWTGTSSATIIYDSTVDEFTHDGLFNKVKGKRNIAIVGFTTDGDVFGGFYSVAVHRQSEDVWDPNIFAFSFESRGRCMTPQRFVVRNGQEHEASVFFWKDFNRGFVQFEVGRECWFLLGDEASTSFCYKLSLGFEGLEDTTLTGKNVDYFRGPNFHRARLVAVQLS